MQNTNKNGVGVVVGRFQVHQLHEAHMALLQKANQHKKLLVFVGVHPFLVTPTDPLDFPTRERMIRKEFPEAMIVAASDHPSDETWSKNLDKAIRTYCPHDKVTLYCGRNGFKDRYFGSFEVKEIEEMSLQSGTEIRNQVSQEVMSSSDFRSGVIYGAYNRYPTIAPTVDIAVIKDDKWVLLGQKPSAPSIWRFPGGFIDINDSSAEAAAIRELHEETGLLTDHPQYVCSEFVDDWRIGAKHKILTFFFVAKYVAGPVQAADDLSQADWFKIEDLAENKINLAKGHRVLAKKLVTIMPSDYNIRRNHG